jgi:CubicO group peptidase (beta-lactamase class C family)
MGPIGRFVSISLMMLSGFMPEGAGARQAQDLAEHPRVAEALNLLSVWMDAHRAYEEIPGISAAVVLGEELLWSEGFGYADLDSQRPATPQTAYSICSISKLFTSISAMQLRDQGRFRLDDEVSSIVPWFTLDIQHPDGPPITVEGLLTHSAGIPRESDHPYWTAPFNFPTIDEVREGVPGQTTLYPPWDYFQYSNLGLTLIGEIVAETSGKSFTDYVRENILSPLGMSSTTPEISDFHGNPILATGYSALRRTGDRAVVETFAGNGIAPAMGFASTVEDLARFAAWQLRLLRNGEEEILAANTLREMHRVHYVDPSWNTTWGLGFSVSRRGDKTFVGHGGSCPGYRSNLEIQVDDSLAAIVMANAMVNTGIYTRRAYEILAPALKAAQEDKENEAKGTPEEFLRYVGVYDSYPWGGESQVIPWKGSLAVVSFPTDDPMGGLTRLKHIEGHTFRRIRPDETLAEERTFEVDADGNVLRMWVHGNSSPKIR